MKILVLHGVNLNMFGQRDKRHYGTATLAEINRQLLELASGLGCELDIFQSNDEAAFIGKIHEMAFACSGVVINAGAWTHYNHAIADALAIMSCPIVEVHMSRVFDREQFRAKSVLAHVAAGSIAGFDIDSYLLGLRAVVGLISRSVSADRNVRLPSGKDR